MRVTGVSVSVGEILSVGVVRSGVGSVGVNVRESVCECVRV